ncbi:MAG TPA: NAD(P)-dependent oxidoreductase [Cyclobacteriaceae bacterium]|nr:NAD(P)-dependent oxidoreductase [Cyclobacteriaceae bacterium]
MFSGKRILITGAAGFIGRNLASQLVKAGADVHGTSRTDRAGDPLRITWWKSSFEDIDTVRSILGDVQPHIIFHLAGRVTGVNDLDNVLPAYHSLASSTVNILTVASKLDCDRIIIPGSSNEPLDCNPNSPYAAAKFIASMYGRFFYRLYDTPVVIARPFVGYGPGQPADKLIPYVISQLLENKRPRLSSGAWRTDWIYIDDMVEGILRCATTPGIEGCSIDIGTGMVASVRDIVKKIVQMIEPKVMPDFGALADRFDEHTPVANVTDTWDKIQWKATTSLDEGLKKTIIEYTRYKREVAESLDR